MSWRSEMRRILSGKRWPVAAMTAGERHDLELFKAGYPAHCKAG